MRIVHRKPSLCLTHDETIGEAMNKHTVQCASAIFPFFGQTLTTLPMDFITGATGIAGPHLIPRAINYAVHFVFHAINH